MKKDHGYWNQSAKALAVDHGVDAANSKNGYIVVWRDGVREYLHRWLWTQLVGPIPDGHQIDHINGIRTDCRLKNLRCVPRSLNLRNSSKNKNNTSGKTGVVFDKAQNAWCARWRDPNTSKVKQKMFTVNKHGDAAFDLACNARDTAIADLNKQAAGYTQRHGK